MQPDRFWHSGFSRFWKPQNKFIIAQIFDQMALLLCGVETLAMVKTWVRLNILESFFFYCSMQQMSIVRLEDINRKHKKNNIATLLDKHEFSHFSLVTLSAFFSFSAQL